MNNEEQRREAPKGPFFFAAQQQSGATRLPTIHQHPFVTAESRDREFVGQAALPILRWLSLGRPARADLIAGAPRERRS
jgi:hypothetical protein